MGYVFLIVILVVYGAFLIYKERFIFFRKNKELLDKLQHATTVKQFDNVWCSFSASSLQIVSSGFFAQVYLLPEGIAIIDEYTLDQNKNREKYAGTYLITTPKGKPKIDKHLFRNFALIQELSISEDGKLKIRIQNFQQSAFKCIGFFPTSYYMNMVLSLPLQKHETIELLKKIKVPI